MSCIAILGAGPLGAAIAERLTRTGWCRAIVFIDPAHEVAAGKALDIRHEGPIEGFDTHVSATADMAACASASLILVADSAVAPFDELQGEPALSLVARAARSSLGAPILCAGNAHRWLVEHALLEVPGKRGRVVGTAPHALVAAGRAMLAAHLDVSALDVRLPLVGVPPRAIVVLWEYASVGDAPALAVCDAQVRRKVEHGLASLWPLGPYALASAASAAATACLTASHRRFTCFTAMDVGEAVGAVGMTSVRLDATGVASAHLPPLTARETLAVERAVRA